MSVSLLKKPILELFNLTYHKGYMLFLMLSVGNNRYVLECRQIKKIINIINCKKIAQISPAVTGLANYGGQPIFVVDFTYLIEKRYSEVHFSTRIILFEFVKEDGKIVLVGLMAEKVTEAINLSFSDFIESGIQLPYAPYLGGLLTDQEGVIQYVSSEKLLAFITQIIFQEEKLLL